MESWKRGSGGCGRRRNEIVESRRGRVERRKRKKRRQGQKSKRGDERKKRDEENRSYSRPTRRYGPVVGSGDLGHEHTQLGREEGVYEKRGRVRVGEREKYEFGKGVWFLSSSLSSFCVFRCLVGCVCVRAFAWRDPQ